MGLEIIPEELNLPDGSIIGENIKNLGVEELAELMAKPFEDGEANEYDAVMLWKLGKASDIAFKDENVQRVIADAKEQYSKDDRLYGVKIQSTTTGSKRDFSNHPEIGLLQEIVKTANARIKAIEKTLEVIEPGEERTVVIDTDWVLNRLPVEPAMVKYTGPQPTETKTSYFFKK